VVCPAFQSTYILNDSMRMSHYSLFLNDSTPKMAMIPKRTKFGVSKKINRFRKAYDLMTAPKENVIGPPARDSLYFYDESEDFVASDFVDMDTLGVDSVSAAPLLAVVEKTEEEKKEYKYGYHPQNTYNSEQEYYNKYYGELFVDERPTVAAMLAGKDFAQPAADTTTVDRKGLKGLFKRRDDKKDLSDELVEGEAGTDVAEGQQLIDDQSVEDSEASPENSDQEEPETVEGPTDTEEPVSIGRTA